MKVLFSYSLFLFLFLSFSISCSKKEILGCTDKTACSFNEEATKNLQGSCSYPTPNYDCEDTCLADTDNNSVCDYDLDPLFEEGDTLEVPKGIFPVKGSSDQDTKDLRHEFLEDIFSAGEGLSYYYIDSFPGDDLVAEKVNSYLKENNLEKILVTKPFKTSEENISHTLEEKSVVYAPLDEGEFSLFQVGEEFIKAEKKEDGATVFAVSKDSASFEEVYVFDGEDDGPYEIPLKNSKAAMVFLGGITVLVGGSLCSSEELVCKKEEKENLGCRNPIACNYNKAASYDDGSCLYPDKHYDCSKECLKDKDGDGICDALEISGCVDKEACNYSSLVTEADNSLCAYEKTWYSDKGDLDKLGDKLISLVSCDQPEGYVLDSTDSNPSCHSDRTDVCSVCDGPGLLTLYEDLDNDLLGDSENSIEACSGGETHVANKNDLCPNDALNDFDADGFCSCTLQDCTGIDFDECPDDSSISDDLDSDADGIPDCVDFCPNGYTFAFKNSKASSFFKNSSFLKSDVKHYVIKLNKKLLKDKRIKIFSNRLETGLESLDNFFKEHVVFDLRNFFSEFESKNLSQGDKPSLVFRFSSYENEDILLSALEPLEAILWYEKIKKVRAFSLSYPPNDYLVSRGDWNLGKVLVHGSDGTDAWDHSTGKNIIIAVLDTGVSDDGSDGFSFLLKGYDFIDNDRHAEDEESHGTHVAGVIAQISNNSKGRSGVAPEASILPLRVLDETGEGTVESVSQGIYFAVNYGAHIINLSLGFPGGEGSFSQVLSDAVDYAEENGVLLVGATGNDSSKELISYPAVFESVLAVGASDKNNEVASYSNWGDEIDLVAPGGDKTEEDIYNGIIQETVLDCEFGYYSVEGTSQAAPHVSGVAALLLSYADENEIDLSLENTKKILRETALDLGTSGFDTSSGYGLVQGKEALDSLISGAYLNFNLKASSKAEILDFKVTQTSSNRAFFELRASEPVRIKEASFYLEPSSLFKKYHRVSFFYEGKETSEIKIEGKEGEKRKYTLSHNKPFF